LSEQSEPKCADDDFYFEPLLPEIIAHFIKLMEAYQALEEEF